MSESYQLDAPIEEALPLNSVPGTGVQQPEDTGNQVICVGEDSPASCCSDKYHRKLAISSIICGVLLLRSPSLDLFCKGKLFSLQAGNLQQTSIWKLSYEDKHVYIWQTPYLLHLFTTIYTSHSSCLLGMIFKSKVLSHLYFTRLRMLTKQRKPSGQEKGELQSI